jgi:hypothetical protein
MFVYILSLAELHCREALLDATARPVESCLDAAGLRMEACLDATGLRVEALLDATGLPRGASRWPLTPSINSQNRMPRPWAVEAHVPS